MAYDYERNVKARSSADQIDLGLKAYMNKVYSFMAVGLALTGVIAHLTSTMAFDFRTNTMTAFGNAIYGSPLAFIIMLAPLGFIIALNMGIAKMKESTVQVLFWAFAAVMGLSLSSIFIQYTGESVARVFFISAGAFGALSLYGYTTKKDLTGWGSFLFIGLIGILIASIVNIFVASSALQFGISVIGVLVFAGLTAYDTQRIKAMYFDNSGQEGKKAIMGALTLYLDFINLFIMLIQLFGQRR
ncbi:MAG: Bax inhibitor-1/YccA family protein [Alphaproteobacteria bacterium]|jgi:FtsH-binding integral membrane protein